jgi:hypothetical protein
VFGPRLVPDRISIRRTSRSARPSAACKPKLISCETGTRTVSRSRNRDCWAKVANDRGRIGRSPGRRNDLINYDQQRAEVSALRSGTAGGIVDGTLNGLPVQMPLSVRRHTIPEPGESGSCFSGMGGARNSTGRGSSGGR